MTYRLRFDKRALKEWKKIDSNVRDQFKRKLAERLNKPRVLAAKISGADNCYKIKLRSVGYRLVYQVKEKEVVVLVLTVGKRQRNAVYHAALGGIE